MGQLATSAWPVFKTSRIIMAREKRRMTQADFDAVLPLLKNVSKDRCEAAKSALVDGETLAVVAARHGCTRQAINNTVNTFWQKATDYHEAQRATANAGVLLPPGWEQVTLIAPRSLVEKFRSEIAAAATLSSSDQKRSTKE
jgi:hypothetical protein